MSRSLEFFAKQSSWLAALSALHAKNNAFVWLEDACDPSETPSTVVKPWLQAKPPNPVNKCGGAAVAEAMAADLNAAAATVQLGGGHCLKITAFPYHHNLMHARNVSLQITAKFVMLIAYIMIPHYIAI